MGEKIVLRTTKNKTGSTRDLTCCQVITDRDVHDGRPIIVQIFERNSLWEWEQFYSLS